MHMNRTRISAVLLTFSMVAVPLVIAISSPVSAQTESFSGSFLYADDPDVMTLARAAMPFCKSEYDTHNTIAFTDRDTHGTREGTSDGTAYRDKISTHTVDTCKFSEARREHQISGTASYENYSYTISVTRGSSTTPPPTTTITPGVTPTTTAAPGVTTTTSTPPPEESCVCSFCFNVKLKLVGDDYCDSCDVLDPCTDNGRLPPGVTAEQYCETPTV